MAEPKIEELSASLLPQSGRAILIRKLGMRAMEACDDHALSAYPRPDQQGKRENARSRELLMRALHSITREPVDYVIAPKKDVSDRDVVDVKATVDSVKSANGGGGWTALSYMQLADADGELGIDKIFEEYPLDYKALVTRAENLAYRPRGGWGKALPDGDLLYVVG